LVHVIYTVCIDKPPELNILFVTTEHNSTLQSHTAWAKNWTIFKV